MDLVIVTAFQTGRLDRECPARSIAGLDFDISQLVRVQNDSGFSRAALLFSLFFEELHSSTLVVFYLFRGLS